MEHLWRLPASQIAHGGDLAPSDRVNHEQDAPAAALLTTSNATARCWRQLPHSCNVRPRHLASLSPPVAVAATWDLGLIALHSVSQQLAAAAAAAGRGRCCRFQKPKCQQTCRMTYMHQPTT